VHNLRNILQSFKKDFQKVRENDKMCLIMDLLRDFRQLSKNDVDIAGGKGASLGEMTQARISVPPGFVILSTAFEKFLEETDLNVEIDSILDSVNHKEIHTVESASEKIQALILQAEMPKDIAIEIQKFFETLNTKYVAVRSSATAEDSASAAWAGQLDSFLNTTEESLLENVKKCWASLFTPRAIFYRFEKNLDKQKISVAVVVQKMVESEKSGIAFSVHPVTQDRNQLIIEAGFGLGEAIVSGQITPDSYVVEKQPRRIIDKNVQIQSRGLYRAKIGGNEWLDISIEQGEKQVLSDTEILELSEIILLIENHYGFPSDIEWAFENGSFYIVQSRPITTLTDIVETNGQNNQLVQKFLSKINDNEIILWDGAYSPLCLLFHWNMQKFYNSFYNIPASPALELIDGRNGLLAFNNSYYKNYAHEIFERYWNKDESVTRQNIKSKTLANEIDKLYHLIQEKNLNDVAEKQLVSWVEEMNCIVGELEAITIHIELFDENIVLAVVGSKNKDFVNKIWEKATHPVFESFEMRRLRLIVKEFEKNSEKAFKRLQFIHTDYFDIKNIVESKKLLSEVVGNKQVLLESKKKLDEYRIDLAKKLDSFKVWASTLSADEKRLAEYAQTVMEMRDWRKDPLAQAQTIFANICREMLLRMSLPEEIAPYILPQELELGIEYLKKQDLLNRPNGMIAFKDIDGTLVVEVRDIKDVSQEVKNLVLGKHHDTEEIKGQIGAKGKVTGIVKIIRDASLSDNFENDDILVTGMTRPEFVPLMKKASGIITDEGGITCHAAIISRELGLPCVIGTKIATKILKDGDLVELDANNGIVRIIEKAK